MEKGRFRRFQVGKDFVTSVPAWFSWEEILVRQDVTVVDSIVEGKVGTEMGQ
jgi:predicted thioredoxin/glutaredoxin